MNMTQAKAFCRRWEKPIVIGPELWAEIKPLLDLIIRRQPKKPQKPISEFRIRISCIAAARLARGEV